MPWKLLLCRQLVPTTNANIFYIYIFIRFFAVINVLQRFIFCLINSIINVLYIN